MAANQNGGGDNGENTPKLWEKILENKRGNAKGDEDCSDLATWHDLNACQLMGLVGCTYGIYNIYRLTEVRPGQNFFFCPRL